jgi:single-strand DNA-binding protein
MLNVVVETGRLVATPELKQTKQDKPVACTRFRIAVDRDYKQEGKDRVTDFFRVICWKSTAEHACKCFSKGQLITIRGSLQTNTYTDGKGAKHEAVEIVADKVYFAEQKESSDSVEK